MVAAVNFREIDFGPDDSKGDSRLSEYFVRIPEYESVRAGKAAFVIGRKGTGKTAICRMIHDAAQDSATMFSVLLSFKNAPRADLLASSDNSFRSPNQYISIWKFFIALEASKLVLQDESVASGTRAALDKFLRENFGNIDVASLDAVSTLKRRSWKIGLTLPLEHFPGAEVARDTFDSSVQQVHYGRAASVLLSYLNGVRSENEFFLLFDELDEDYRRDDAYFHLLISLLKAVYQVCQEVTVIKLRPIVVLREDIFSQLDDHDLNKMRDLTVRLRWSTAPSRQNQFSLRGLINQRIRASSTTDSSADLWPMVVDETHWGGRAQSAWRFLVDRTMERPRDLIVSLKCCQRLETDQKLSAATIRTARAEYSEWLYNELGNEVFRVLPEYRDALGILTRIARDRFTLDVWRGEFGKDETLSSKYRPDWVLEWLYNFSVVGISRGGSTVFKYRTPHVTFDKGAVFSVHKGLRRHLVIPSEGRRRSR